MSKKPTMIAYTVKERGDGQKAIWKRIGAAWPHGSGAGFTLQLDTPPLDGRIHGTAAGAVQVVLGRFR
jgi:hypothetical protein